MQALKMYILVLEESSTEAVHWETNKNSQDG